MKRTSPWDEVNINTFVCSVCHKPFRTSRGMRIHYTRCHTDNASAERKWNICMMHYEGDCSVREVACFFREDSAYIQRVLANVAQYQHYYELDPELLKPKAR